MEIKFDQSLLTIFLIKKKILTLLWKKKSGYNSFKLKAIQAKYEALSEPIYTKNNEIIQGTRNPTNDEITNLNTYLTAEETA